MNSRAICKHCPSAQPAACERLKGNSTSAIVLDFPTILEAKKGKLLVDDVGRLLKAVLEGNGKHLSDYYITTALNCRPIGNRESILRESMEKCKYRLLSELHSQGIDQVLCLGPIGWAALKSLPRIPRTVKTRGCWRSAYGMSVMMTYSPIAVLTDLGLFRDFANDIQKFIETERETFPHLTITIPESAKEVNRWFRVFQRDKYLSCDFETTGFSPIDNEPIALGYCSISEFDPHVGGAMVIPYHLLQQPTVWQAVSEQLSSNQATVFHNAKFDLKFMQHWMKRYGSTYDPVSIGDTMLLNYCLDERPIGKFGAHGLESLARTRYDAPYYGIDMGKWLKQWEATGRPLEMMDKMYEYCGIDVYYTARLYPDLLEDIYLESPRLLEVYNHLLMPGSLALADVELRGMRLDTEQLQKLRETLVSQRDELLQGLREYTENEEFNPNSTRQVYNFLYKELKLPIYDTGRRGKQKEGPTSAGVLKILQIKRPESADFVDQLLEYRICVKGIGTYVDGFLKRVSSDGKIHTDFLLMGTETGRTSSRNPNMQNVQEVSNHNINVRGCFKPVRKDWTLLEGDYSQLELRVAAHLSGDSNWIQIFREGKDTHQDVAEAIFGRTHITPHERTVAKGTVFGAMYGQGEQASALGSYTAVFFDRYKDFKKWTDKQVKLAYTQQYVETIFGRRRRFPLLPRNDGGLIKRQAVNTPIQSPASDITLDALIRIHNRLLHMNAVLGRVVAYVLLTIHDSIVVECWDKVVDKVERIMLEEMENVPIETSIPFKVEIHRGKDWTSLK